MNKYLEKIAKEVDKKKKMGIAGGLGAGYVAASAAQLADLSSKGPIKGEITKHHTLDKHTLKKVLRDNKDLDVTFSGHKAFTKNVGGKALHEAMGGQGPSYLDKNRAHDAIAHQAKMKGGLPHDEHVLRKNYVHMGKGPFGKDSFGGLFSGGPGKDRTQNINVAMHELGHARDAKNLHKLGLGKADHHALAASRKFGPVGHLVGGAMLSNEKTRDYAWTAPLVSHAATLRSEGAANYHGYKMLARHANSAAKGKFLATAGKNMLGYGAAPAAGALALHALNKWNKKREAKK